MMVLFYLCFLLELSLAGVSASSSSKISNRLRIQQTSPAQRCSNVWGLLP